MDKDEQEKHEEVGRKLHEKLCAIGIPAAVAAMIIGALYALAAALGLITLNGCSASYTQTAEGDVRMEAAVVTPSK